MPAVSGLGTRTADRATGHIKQQENKTAAEQFLLQVCYLVHRNIFLALAYFDTPTDQICSFFDRPCYTWQQLHASVRSDTDAKHLHHLQSKLLNNPNNLTGQLVPLSCPCLTFASAACSAIHPPKLLPSRKVGSPAKPGMSLC